LPGLKELRAAGLLESRPMPDLGDVSEEDADEQDDLFEDES
jgi:segregation and condensation protein B